MFRVRQTTHPRSISELTASSILLHLPRDFWGREYGYRRTPAGAETFSMGPDRRPGTQDDVRLEMRSSRRWPAAMVMRLAPAPCGESRLVHLADEATAELVNQ